jgi:hypothetical protein
MTSPLDSHIPLLRALKNCTVAISSGKLLGSGFFVGPGLILTCAHVVAGADGVPAGDIAIEWNGLEMRGELKTERYHPKPGPDVALLEVSLAVQGIENHPYALIDVRLDAVDVGQTVISYGFPERDRSGDTATFEVEGVPMRPSGLAKLKAGQAEKGMSGAPVLSITTGAVCGMLRYTRDRYTDLGARFITMHSTAAALPDLLKAQKTSQTHPWLRVLTDPQLQAGRHKFAGSRLREYLSAVSISANTHPYALALGKAPPLETVYVHQIATPADAESAEYRSGLGSSQREPSEVPSHGPPIPASAITDSQHGAVVIGGPGAGKSSLLRHLTFSMANRWLADEEATFVPVRIPAESLAGEMPFTDALAASVTRDLGGKSLQAYTPEFFRLPAIADTPWLVMVDGVDELLDEELRLKVLNVIDSHRDSVIYKFLIASRPLARNELDLVAGPDLPIYFIEPFSEALLPTFAAGWFEALQVPDAERLLEKFVKGLESYRLRQLTRIPLIATMTCIVFANDAEILPSSRRELYAEFIGSLSGKQLSQLDIRERLKARLIPEDPNAPAAVDNLIRILPSVLETVAYERQAGNQQRITDLSFSRLKKLRPAKVEINLWEEIVREALRQSGLLIENGGDFRFIHQSIEEYLAASKRVTQIHPGERRRAKILLGTGRGRPFSENMRLFLASIWIDNGHDLHRALRYIIRKNTPQAASFIASLILDGGTIPGKLLVRANELMERKLGTLTVHSSGFLSIEAILILQDSIQTRNLTRRSADRRLSYSDRLSAVSALSDLQEPADIKRVQKVMRGKDRTRLRIMAARSLALTGQIDGKDFLLSVVNDARWAVDDRINAASELGALDKTLSQGLLVQLSRDVAFPLAGRVKAAVEIKRYDTARSRDLLIELSWLPVRSANFRLELANYLLEVWRHPRGEEIYRDLVNDHEANSFDRLEAARILMKIDPSEGARGIVKIATDSSTSPPLRKLLARQFTFVDWLEVYRSIAFDSGAEDVYRVEALRKILTMSPIEGVQAISILANDKSLTEATRLRLSELRNREEQVDADALGHEELGHEE